MGWSPRTLLTAVALLAAVVEESNARSPQILAQPLQPETPIIPVQIDGNDIGSIPDSYNGVPNLPSSSQVESWQDTSGSSLESRQVAVPAAGCAQCSGPLVSININDCILGTIPATINGVTTLVATLTKTLSAVAANTLKIVNGVAGGAGGFLNCTLVSVTEVLGTSTRSLITVSGLRRNLTDKLTHLVCSVARSRQHFEGYTVSTSIGSAVPWVAVLGLLQLDHLHWGKDGKRP